MRAHAPSLHGADRLRSAVRIASGLSGAALVAIHGWVLANQFADGRLSDPGLASRWLIAGALVAGLATLRRSGGSMWSGKGIAIWLLAALLHGPAVASSDHSGVLALPEAVVTVVVQVAASAGALALGLWVLGSLLGAAVQPSLLPLAARASAARIRPAPSRRPFSPRPPPRV